MTVFVSFSTIFGLSLPTLLFLMAIITAGFYQLYRMAMPHPIPGVPYNKESAKRILGDGGPMIENAKATHEIFTWLREQNMNLHTPISQIFLKPFAKPTIIITDFKETQDICLRRTKEFDRTTAQANIFAGVVPEHHIGMKTADPRYKQHRRWLQDLMTPAFLHEIAAPHIQAAFEDLMQLWEKKAQLADGHPFSGKYDIYEAALDAVWSILFGANIADSTMRTQLQALAHTKALDLPVDIDKEAPLPHVPLPKSMDAVVLLTESIGIAVRTPFPIFTHWVYRQRPSMRNAKAVKDKFIAGEVEKTRSRFMGKADSNKDVRCAMDDILRREILLSEKEGRQPVFHSRGMYDEIFGFAIAAHDTTATAITWAVKILADHQDVQSKLRSKLRSAFVNAVAEKRKPTYQEVTKTAIPYLDASIEELIRCSLTEPTVTRESMVDVDVLGHRIPKGTAFFLLGNGPSMFSPAFEIDDSLRSPSALAAKERVGTWDPRDMGLFKPERWLVKEGDKEVFDANAGPLLTFGLGPRGCYGRRMAYLELRLVLVLIIWNFELQKCPAELNNYSAEDKVVHAPQQSYLRLKKTTW